MTVLVVLEPSTGAGLSKAWLRVVGTLVGGAAGLLTLHLAFLAGAGENWAGGRAPGASAPARPGLLPAEAVHRSLSPATPPAPAARPAPPLEQAALSRWG